LCRSGTAAGQSPCWRVFYPLGSGKIPTSKTRSCGGAQVRALHRGFLLEILDVTEDRGCRQHFAIAAKAHQAIASVDIALDVEAVPFLRVTDIVDRHVVMLAPEERHLTKALSLVKHVAGGSLPLTLGNDPMLNAQIFAGMRIGPARDVAGGEDSRRAGFKIFVHDDAAIDLE